MNNKEIGTAAQEYAEKKLARMYPDHIITTTRDFKSRKMFDACEIARAYKAGAYFALTNQWRRVKDSLPQEHRTVLVYIDSEDIRELKIALAHRDGKDFHDITGSKISPSYWSYVPQFNPEKEEK